MGSCCSQRVPPIAHGRDVDLSGCAPRCRYLTGVSRLIPRTGRLAVAFVATAALAASCSSSDNADQGVVTTVPSIVSTTASTVPPTIATTSTTAKITTTTSTTTTTAPPLGPYALTGLEADDMHRQLRPALAVKIDNVEAARPQAGLVEADVVFEEIVEGGLTRLLAIFHSRDAGVIGPVRSARSTDVPLLTPLREPLFAWSGANGAFAALIRSVAIRDVGFEIAPAEYERADDRSAPSDLMTTSDGLYALVDVEGDHAPNELFDFLPAGEVRDGGRDVNGVEVAYGATTVRHEWDNDAGGWARTQNDTPHVDAEGDVIAPENVIVQFVNYRNSGLVDSSGAVVPEADLEGQGVAWFFVDGQLVEGKWVKANVTATSAYADSDGNTMQFSPGRTWVLLAREGSAELL